MEFFNSRGYKTISNNKITHLKNDIKDWDEEWHPKDVTWRNYQDPLNRTLDQNKKPAAAYERLEIDDSVHPILKSLLYFNKLKEKFDFSNQQIDDAILSKHKMIKTDILIIGARRYWRSNQSCQKRFGCFDYYY